MCDVPAGPCASLKTHALLWCLSFLLCAQHQNARNVLVSSDGACDCGMVAKLADLGLSRMIKQHATHRTTETVGE